VVHGKRALKGHLREGGGLHKRIANEKKTKGKLSFNSCESFVAQTCVVKGQLKGDPCKEKLGSLGKEKLVGSVL